MIAAFSSLNSQQKNRSHQNPIHRFRPHDLRRLPPLIPVIRLRKAPRALKQPVTPPASTSRTTERPLSTLRPVPSPSLTLHPSSPPPSRSTSGTLSRVVPMRRPQRQRGCVWPSPRTWAYVIMRDRRLYETPDSAR